VGYPSNGGGGARKTSRVLAQVVFALSGRNGSFAGSRPIRIRTAVIVVKDRVSLQSLAGVGRFSDAETGCRRVGDRFKRSEMPQAQRRIIRGG